MRTCLKCKGGAGASSNDRGRAASAGIRGSKFRHGLLTLMIHSIDPMHDGGNKL